MRGPFDALIDKSRRQMSLFLGSRYAGSFAVGFGQDQPAADGYYQVGGKSFEPSTSVRWLDLGNGITVHSTVDNVPLDSDQARGCIRLDPAQAADVLDILSVGSEVIVRP
jgi:lipoprotein-anchoring transpeptidase ErfK/SrfK